MGEQAWGALDAELLGDLAAGSAPPLSSRDLRTDAAWPLVGRAAELVLIRRAVADGEGGAVLVGPAGVGKTRVARAVREELKAEGLSVAAVVATESAASIPLGVFAHLLPARESGAMDLVELLAAAAATLVERAGGDRLVLTVDDAHLLDDASAALVHQLALSPSVFVVATVRSREQAPDAVVALWKDQLALRIDLEPLGPDATEDLVRNVLGGVPDHTLLHTVGDVTRGNPLFLRELLFSGLESGALAETGGVWRWHGPIGAGTRLQELVESRMSRLADAHHAALELTALGEPIGVQLLEDLVGIEVVDRLERQELIVVQRDQRREQVWLAHPLYGEVLRAGTTGRRARGAQRALADALAAAGARRRDDVLRIALWRLDGGGEIDAPALVAGAAQAEAAFDLALAERLARAAVAAGGGSEADIALGRALWQQGRAQEAEEVWAAVSARGDAGPSTASLHLYRAINLFFKLGRPDVAEQVLVAGEAMAHVQDRAAFVNQRATFALYGGRPNDALALTERALGDPEKDAETFVNATVITATALAITGRSEQACAVIDQALPAAFDLQGGGAMLAGQLLAARFLALSFAGRLEDAHQLAEITHELALQRRSHDGVAALSLALGQVWLMRGRPRTALRWLREAAELLRVQDRSGYLPWALAELACAAAVVGELEEAQAALDEASRTRQPSLRLFEVELAVARVALRRARGLTTEAVDVALDAGDWAEETGQLNFAVVALHEVVRSGRARDVSDRIASLAEQSDSALVHAMAARAVAGASGDADALEAAADAFERIDALLFAAEAMAEASALHRTAGRGAAAAAAAQRGRTLLGACEGAVTPAVRMLDASLPLTTREEEVASLAAEGLSSREIAERLFVSVRTVDNHLHRAYYKLGVGSRSELRAVLGARGTSAPE